MAKKMVYEITKSAWMDVEEEGIEDGDVWDFPQCELKDILNGDFSDEDIEVYGRVYDDELDEIRYGEMPSLSNAQAKRKFGEGKPMAYWAEQTPAKKARKKKS